MDFVITITDPAQLAGITWAREQRNASSEDQIATDQDYIGWVMTQAAASYARDRGNTVFAEAKVAAEGGDMTKLDEVQAEYAAESLKV